MENVAKESTKNKKRIEKKKEKEKDANKFVDVELTEVKVEMTSNHSNQKSQVYHHSELHRLLIICIPAF